MSRLRSSRWLVLHHERRLAEHKHAGDIAVVSIHRGPNWGFEIAPQERRFAHALLERAGADLLHGHSSHLRELIMTPTCMRRFRVIRADPAQTEGLRDTLNREGERLVTAVGIHAPVALDARMKNDTMPRNVTRSAAVMRHLAGKVQSTRSAWRANPPGQATTRARRSLRSSRTPGHGRRPEVRKPSTIRVGHEESQHEQQQRHTAAVRPAPSER
jgi:hypothetical protein